jgi:hypothetical protein
MVHVQHPLWQAGFPSLAHGAVFAGAVARHIIAMRHLMAFLAQRRLPLLAELGAVGTVGGDYPIVGVKHDRRLWVVLQVGAEAQGVERSHGLLQRR